MYAMVSAAIGVCGYVTIASFVIWWIIFLAVYYQYQPRDIRAAVANATLSNLTVVVARNGTTVAAAYVNLTVKTTLYNPSAHANIIYYDDDDSLNASLLLGHNTAAVLVAPAGSTCVLADTYHRHKSNDTLQVDFDAIITGEMADQLHKDINNTGAASFDMLIRGRVRYRSAAVAVKTPKRLGIRCQLDIPVNKTEVGRHGGVDGVLPHGGGRCKEVTY